jgi:hypothetical protein
MPPDPRVLIGEADRSAPRISQAGVHDAAVQIGLPTQIFFLRSAI